MLESMQLNMNEWRLLQALNSGMGNKDLALMSMRSEYTIRNQLSSLYKKIKVRNRVRAIVWYREFLLRYIPTASTPLVDRRQGPTHDRRKANRQGMNAEAANQRVFEPASTGAVPAPGPGRKPKALN